MVWPVVKKYSLLCGLVLAVLGLQACKHTGESPGTNYTSLDDFFKRHDVELQQFIIDPTKDTSIAARNGVKLFFAAHAFTNMYTGQTITTPVRISFRQVHTKGEIIFTNKPTQTAHDILETAGSFYLHAQTNIHTDIETSTELEICKGKVRIDWPANGKPDAAMQLFNGRETEIFTHYFIWDYISEDKVIADIENNIYTIFPTHLQWINIDKFSKDSTGKRSEIYMKLPEGFDNKNSISFMVFNDAETVLSSKKLFFELIPANKKVTFITIGIKDAKFYLGRKPFVTPETDTEVNMKMNLASKEELLETLNKL